MKATTYTKAMACLMMLLSANSLMAQGNISVGIKAGLGFSTILLADQETDADGNSLEENSYLTGFHLGVSMNIDIIEDKFGVMPEFQFVQKGGRKIYEGPGVIQLNTTTGNPFNVVGARREALPVVNTYLDFPVLLYYKPIPKIKLAAGVNAGFLVASQASGETRMTWTDLAGAEQVLTIGLDHNYYGDKAGEAASSSMETLPINGGGTVLEYPSEAGAYYFYTEKDGSRYKVFDLGLNAELSYALSGGLALGVRVNYGLLDVTNDDMDFSLNTSDPTQNEKRLDNDHNLSFQIALGFNF